MRKIESFLRVFIYNMLSRGVYIAWGSFIGRNVTVGFGTNINQKSFIDGPCSIGKHCAIAGNLIVRTSNHDFRFPNVNYITQKKYVRSELVPKDYNNIGVRIGNAVWIGDRVTILPGVSIGDGAVIAAGSVIFHDVESFAIVAGNPAKTIDFRFSEIVRARIANEAWWHLPPNELANAKKFFETKIE